jgi:hypothetical protein
MGGLLLFYPHYSLNQAAGLDAADLVEMPLGSGCGWLDLDPFSGHVRLLLWGYRMI